MKCIFLLILIHSSSLMASDTFLNRGNGSEPDSLDIHQAQGLNSHNILFDLYEGLMTFDVKGEAVYGVAQSHSVNSDFTHWQFTLRPDAKWSDGRVVTANDFIQAWQLAIDPATAAPYRQLFDNMMQQGQLNIQSEHAQHISIQLNQPDAGLLNKLVLPIFYPLPEQEKPLNVTNGAFYLHQWDLQERITLLKNPHHHDVNNIHLDGVHYWVTENQNSELLRFRAKELDITETIPDGQIEWLRKHMPDELRIAPYYGTFFLGLNLNHKHLKDPYLRQALSQAIDRNILVDKVLKTGQLPATRIIPPEQTQNDDLIYDPQSAAERLLRSDFNVATDRLEILYNNSDNQKKVALAVAAMWRQNLGIKSSLKNQEWKVFINTRRTNQKQVFRSGWIADFLDPLNFLELFHSQSHFNFYAFNDPEYDALIFELRGAVDEQSRRKLITHAEQILANQLPVIPLYHYVSRHLVQTHIKGFVNNDMDRHLSRYLKKVME